ncbi:hypothetical protein Pst134EB_027278 [Puccinia striiformis f. sp. tritici]|nr:hypothetical protein Pst134EB_027278 [Puccinia striiformis f. sp. tritici]
MSMIRQCYECKLFKSYSWRALQDMLIKVNNNLDYDADKKAHNNFDTSFRKLHSLAKGSFNESRHFIQPEDPTSKEGDPTFKQDSIEGAGRFIIRRIRALKTGADTVSGAAENRATNGFVLIEKRIWETLLCCLMMQQAKFHSDIKFCLSTGTFVDQAQKDSAKMTSYDKGRSLFKNGDLTARESQVAEKTIVKRILAKSFWAWSTNVPVERRNLMSEWNLAYCIIKQHMSVSQIRFSIKTTPLFARFSAAPAFNARILRIINFPAPSMESCLKVGSSG